MNKKLYKDSVDIAKNNNQKLSLYCTVRNSPVRQKLPYSKMRKPNLKKTNNLTQMDTKKQPQDKLKNAYKQQLPDLQCIQVEDSKRYLFVDQVNKNRVQQFNKLTKPQRYNHLQQKQQKYYQNAFVMRKSLPNYDQYDRNFIKTQRLREKLKNNQYTYMIEDIEQQATFRKQNQNSTIGKIKKNRDIKQISSQNISYQKYKRSKQRLDEKISQKKKHLAQQQYMSPSLRSKYQNLQQKKITTCLYCENKQLIQSPFMRNRQNSIQKIIKVPQFSHEVRSKQVTIPNKQQIIHRQDNALKKQINCSTNLQSSHLNIFSILFEILDVKKTEILNKQNLNQKFFTEQLKYIFGVILGKIKFQNHQYNKESFLKLCDKLLFFLDNDSKMQMLTVLKKRINEYSSKNQKSNAQNIQLKQGKNQKQERLKYLNQNQFDNCDENKQRKSLGCKYLRNYQIGHIQMNSKVSDFTNDIELYNNTKQQKTVEIELNSKYHKLKINWKS